MKIVIILGSVRQGRQTHHIANYLNKRLNETGKVEANILDLGTRDLPILEDQWRKQAEPSPALAAFSKELVAADGIVLASPEYHGSYTGVIKNALDHFWEEFRRKPMGVVATGSGKFGGINASIQMQQLILSLGAYAMPQKLLVPHIQKAFDQNGNPQGESLIRDVELFVEEMVWFTHAIMTAHKRP